MGAGDVQRMTLFLRDCRADEGQTELAEAKHAEDHAKGVGAEAKEN